MIRLDETSVCDSLRFKDGQCLCVHHNLTGKCFPLQPPLFCMPFIFTTLIITEKKYHKTKYKVKTSMCHGITESDKSDQSVALTINKKAHLNRANIFESDIFLYYRRVRYEKTTNPMICLADLSLIKKNTIFEVMLY